MWRENHANVVKRIGTRASCRTVYSGCFFLFFFSVQSIANRIARFTLPLRKNAKRLHRKMILRLTPQVSSSFAAGENTTLKSAEHDNNNSHRYRFSERYFHVDSTTAAISWLQLYFRNGTWIQMRPNTACTCFARARTWSMTYLSLCERMLLVYTPHICVCVCV